LKLIDQSWEWVDEPRNVLVRIMRAGATCYKSEPQHPERFVRMLMNKGHESVIEHVSASVRIITNRGVTHELVRHRLASFSQESTRYCNYGGKEMEFIRPVWWNSMPEDGLGQKIFIEACEEDEYHYKQFIGCGWRPEQAREVLPNALKTEIVMTANLREWRHVFKLRTSKAAHPQMRALMLDLLSDFKEAIPVIFEDIKP